VHLDAEPGAGFRVEADEDRDRERDRADAEHHAGRQLLIVDRRQAAEAMVKRRVGGVERGRGEGEDEREQLTGRRPSGDVDRRLQLPELRIQRR